MQNFSISSSSSAWEYLPKQQKLGGKLGDGEVGANGYCALLPALQGLGCSSGYPNFNSSPRSQEFVSWLLPRSKEPKTFDKPFLFVFSSRYGEASFSGVETETLTSCSVAEGHHQRKVEHLAPFPTAQVPGAAVRPMHKQTAFRSCRALGKISNHRTKFLRCGRKMPENYRRVKHESKTEKSHLALPFVGDITTQLPGRQAG